MAEAYAPISDYALIGDCHSAALVSREGSIDWCCLPRFDSGSTFGRLLDRDRGGYCSVAPVDESLESTREYIGDTLVLETTFESSSGEARLIDCFVVKEDTHEQPAPEHAGIDREIVRVIAGVRGMITFELRVAPRFDYGQVRPWIRRHGERVFSTIGGD